MAFVLALLASVLWGVGDFAGGTASRRVPVLYVAILAQAVGLFIIICYAYVTGAWSYSPQTIPWALAAGIAGSMGLVAFYLALAHGTMGIVAPISALSVLAPVFLDWSLGYWPPPMVGLGIAIAVVGVVISAKGAGPAKRSRFSIKMSLCSAALFGAVLIFVAKGADFSPTMMLVHMRLSSVIFLTILIMTLRYAGPNTSGVDDEGSARTGGGSAVLTLAPSISITASLRGKAAWLIALAGGADTFANFSFANASNAADLSIAAVLSSLFPAVIAILGWMIHKERLVLIQKIGVVGTLAAVVLIAGWS